jgi:hypothetical protein
LKNVYSNRASCTLRVSISCVGGVQLADPQTPLNSLRTDFFEVGKIKSVSLTDQPFLTNGVIDRFDGKYVNGIICSIY